MILLGGPPGTRTLNQLIKSQTVHSNLDGRWGHFRIVVPKCRSCQGRSQTFVGVDRVTDRVAAPTRNGGKR